MSDTEKKPFKKPETEKTISAPPPPPPVKAETKKSGKYFVADGRSVVCGNFAGIIGPKKEIKLEFFGKDKEIAEKSLKALIKSGAVVEG